VLTLRNRAGLVLTVLHVAHLRVDLAGGRSQVRSGSCQPGEWYGAMAAPAPPGLLAILGLSPGRAGGGTVCSSSGHAHGLPASDIEQTDDRSGGVTRTSVPHLVSFSPTDGAELYGRFVAFARLGRDGAGSTVSVRISRAGHQAFYAPNVSTQTGVDVPVLATGVYQATWTVRDRNGDTRTVQSRLIEAG